MNETGKGGAAPRKGPHSPIAKDKGLIRSLSRGFARTKKRRPVETAVGHLAGRRDRKITGALLERTHWTPCPVCSQAAQEVGFGRVIIRGAYALAHEAAIRRRLANIASRAAHTQPERRFSAIDRRDDLIEVITTSQKLVHRIVHELKKLFRGRASYAWSDDGTLFATWERER